MDVKTQLLPFSFNTCQKDFPTLGYVNCLKFPGFPTYHNNNNATNTLVSVNKQM